MNVKWYFFVLVIGSLLLVSCSQENVVDDAEFIDDVPVDEPIVELDEDDSLVDEQVVADEELDELIEEINSDEELVDEELDELLGSIDMDDW